MEKTSPTISVIMPVYNGEKFLSKAIDSILKQSYTDFEFIIINDGSSDSTEQIIESYHDPRIVYLKNSANLGLSKSFNIGIDKSHGKFIARMDADDISKPNRFERQIQFLEKRPHVDIVGSNLILIDEKDLRCGAHRKQQNHLEIKFSSLFSTPMMHPTIMGKAEVFKSHHYDEGLSNSEDYELWSRLLFKTKTHFANIHEPLLLYRTYPNSFTQTLNLDKRTLSAHNTIQNIEHYVELNQVEKNILVQLRQERVLNIKKILIIFFIYLRAAESFCNKEKTTFAQSLRIYFRLLPLAFFLIKHKIKHL